MNNDGYDDVIVGARFASPSGKSGAGQSYVVFGGPSLAGTTINFAYLGTHGFTLNGAADWDNSGYSVSGAGDVNNDGYDDVIVGANCANPHGKSYAGQSYVVFGGPSLAGTTINFAALGIHGFTLNGAAAHDASGSSVSGAGDVNNDGYDDVIVGADNAGKSVAGKSYVVFGGPNLTGTTINFAYLGAHGFILNGAAADDWSGRSVSGAGDVNNDGYDDVIVGAYNAAPADKWHAGQSYVVFGFSPEVPSPTPTQSPTSAPLYPVTFNANQLDGKQGFTITDVNARDDGAPDVLLGASELGNVGTGKTRALYDGMSFFRATSLHGVSHDNSNTERELSDKKRNTGPVLRSVP